MLFTIAGRYLPSEHYASKAIVFLNILKKNQDDYSRKELGDVLISFEYSKSDYELIKKAIQQKVPRVLIREETDAVYPLQYTTEIEDLFSKVYTLGAAPNSFRGTILRHPYVPYKHNHKMNQILDTDKLVKENVKSGKFDYENWKQRQGIKVFVGKNGLIAVPQLYKFRRKFISNPAFETDVYGENWSRFSVSKIRTLIGFLRYQFVIGNKVDFLDVLLFLTSKAANDKGNLEDKLELLTRYRFNVVFENSLNFVSEKVLDAIICGTVPIYFGGNLEWAHPIKDLVHAIDSNSNFDELLRRLKELEFFDYQKWASQAKDFLRSEDFIGNWTGSGVYQRIYDEIVQSGFSV